MLFGTISLVGNAVRFILLCLPLGVARGCFKGVCAFCGEWGFSEEDCDLAAGRTGEWA